MNKITKMRKTTRPIRARLATVSPQVGPIDDVLTSPRYTVSMASRTTICSSEVSGSVCTRTVDTPVPVLFDATTTGLAAASISVPTTASVTSSTLSLGLSVMAWNSTPPSNSIP